MRLSSHLLIHAQAAVVLALLFIGTSSGFAAEPEHQHLTQEKLEAVIAAQQRQLDLQQKELEAQMELLQELRQQVQNLNAGDKRAATKENNQPLPESAKTAQPLPESPKLAVGEQQEAEPDWPGSFSLFGSKTRFAVGGFVQLDLIHDTDAINTRCDFVTAAIPTDGGTMAAGADGQTSLCVNATRLTFESRTPTMIGRLKTFLSMDFFGNSDTPNLRIRQAYGDLSDAFWGGDLLMGQAWGTFVDLEAWPDVLDFEGPGSAIATRQPMVRWSKGLSDNFDFLVSLEQPGGGTAEGADMLTQWPDLIGAVKWKHGGGHLRGAGILRDLRASANDGPAESALGWGVAGSGKLILSTKNSLVFETSYGKGTGGYYNDYPPNAVYDPASSSLDPLPVFAYYVGFEHAWNDVLSSNLLYSALNVDNQDSQAGDAFNKTTYSSLNLIWRPDSPLMYGIELLRGSREDKDGAEGTDNRIQFTSQFSF